MLTYDDFFDLMDLEVRQAVETGDLTNPDEFRIFPKEKGKGILNRIMDYLSTINKTKFTKNITYTFPVDATKYTLPNNYRELIAFKDDVLDNRWHQADDESNTNAKIYAIDEDALVNTEGWTVGDEISLKVVRYPDKIVDDNDYIDKAFKDHIELLLLECKSKAFGIQGKDMSPLDLQTLPMLRQAWINDVKRIKTRSFLSFNAKSFGGRRSGQ